MPKQVRFTQLIKSSGHPHPATLWVGNPKDDPEFKKAIEENRILTIQNVTVGNKKEAGEIGFVKKGNATFLVFPKALPMAAGTKVVGLKFDQLEQQTVKDPVTVKEAPRSPKVERVKTVEIDDPEPAEKAPVQERHIQKKKPDAKADKPSTFTVTLQFTATVQRDVQVKATTASEAIAAAMKQAEKLTPKKPDWETEALEVKLVKQ